MKYYAIICFSLLISCSLCQTKPQHKGNMKKVTKTNLKKCKDSINCSFCNDTLVCQD